MPKANELKRGMIVRYRDNVCAVRKIDIRTPSSRGSNTLYKVKFQDIQSKQNFDETFKGDDLIEDVDFSRKQATYSYYDGEFHTFLDAEDYTPYALSPDDLGEQVQYLSEGLEDILVMLVEDRPVGIQLPATVEMEIAETAPAIKGATVTKRTKTATTHTGLEVQVPEYLATGEKIKINTDSGDFMSRA